MQQSDSIIGLTFDTASAGLSIDEKISKLLDYRSSTQLNLIEEQNAVMPSPALIAMYTIEISATDLILQSLVK